MADEEQVRRILMQLETGKRQLEQLSRQSQMVESAIAELGVTVEGLRMIKDQKQGVELLVQVGAGSYMKAALQDTETVLVGIGADLSVEKKLPDAVDMLEERKKQLSESQSQIQKTMGELSIKIAELNAQAEQLMAQMQPR